jgi:hypothetical protein
MGEKGVLLRAQVAGCSTGDVFETDRLAGVEARKTYLDVFCFTSERAVACHGDDEYPD